MKVDVVMTLCFSVEVKDEAEATEISENGDRAAWMGRALDGLDKGGEIHIDVSEPYTGPAMSHWKL